MHRKIISILAIAIVIASTHKTFAQQNNKADSLKNIDLPQIVVSGNFKKEQYNTVISRKELNVMQQQTLGGTLSKIAGIQNSYFGPNAGAPVIRSLSGNRVKILNNGLTVSDLSGISPNLNISLDQENIESMEVYKGSASVLYGGKAIGGAINIKTNIVPMRMDKKKFAATAIVDGSSNNGFKQLISLHGNNARNLVWHLGASNHKNKLIRIPGTTKPSICYDPETIGFKPVLQTMAQMNVVEEPELNVTIFPYISQYVLDHLGDPDYGLSENDKYTFEKDYFDSESFTYKKNPKNELYVEGQDPVKDRYKMVVKNISDYVPTKKGEIPNSHSSIQSLNFGLGYLGSDYTISGGYQGNFSYYGVPAYGQFDLMGFPSHAGHSHSHGEKSDFFPINVSSHSHLGMLQLELFKNMPVFRSVKLNLSTQSAKDEELLGVKTANRFDVNLYAARLELQQKEWNFLKGTSGLSYDYRKMNGSGPQRYMPNNDSREFGLFTMQQMTFAQKVHFDLGYRYDKVKRGASHDDGYKKGRGIAGGDLSTRRYDLHQVDLSARLNLCDNSYLRASFNHSERAPEVNELYAGNRHFAIVVEENGSDKLDKEMANTFEVGANLEVCEFQLRANIYRTRYKNYIYLAHTGIAREGFIVKEWRAADTQIDGLELQADYKFSVGRASHWNIHSYYDLVKNKNVSDDEMRQFSDGDYMPNMPTSRVGFNITGNIKALAMYVSFDRYLKQEFLGKHISEEHAFPAYNLLGARMSYSFNISKVNTELYLYETNLLNEEARPQNSMLKYLAPLPGRSIGAGIKIKI